MKMYIKLSFLIIIALLLVSCNNKRSTGVEFAPQMYHSIPLDPYSQMDYNEFNPDKKNMREPAPNTIAYGKLDYIFPYENNYDEYERAGRELKNPLPTTPENIAEGKRLFGYLCTHCHGAEGKGDGTIPNAEKFPPPPAYDGALKDLPEGKAFFSIHYGKNLMGSHASQLTPEERWKIVQFIKTCQAGTPGVMPAAKTEEPVKEETKVETKTEVKKDEKAKATKKNNQ